MVLNWKLHSCSFGIRGGFDNWSIVYFQKDNIKNLRETSVASVAALAMWFICQIQVFFLEIKCKFIQSVW